MYISKCYKILLLFFNQIIKLDKKKVNKSKINLHIYDFCQSSSFSKTKNF